MIALPSASAQQPIVIAHRGASGYLPEHTLAAKALSYGSGADYIEQDLVLSKDGVPIVIHDIHLDSVTDVATKFSDRKRDDGRYYVIDFTVAEIKQLNVTERIQISSGKPVYASRFPAGSTALQLSTLEEELQLIAGLNKSTGKSIGIYPEIKQPGWHKQQGKDVSQIVIDVLRKHGFDDKSDKCFLQCFEWTENQRIRKELNWKGNLVQLLGTSKETSSLLTADGLSELAKVVDAVGPDLSIIVSGKTKSDRQVTDFVTLAHQFGLAVHPYTARADQIPAVFESLEDLHRTLFVQAHVDGLFTDFPDLTAKFVKENRIWITELHAQEPLKIWPDSPPGRIAARGQERDTSDEKSNKVEGQWVVRLGDVSVPTLTYYPAPHANNTGSVVLVCPGGGYNILAWNLEGTEVCQWLNSIGVNAALLKYRVPRVDKDIPIEPLQDAQRALSILRSPSPQWKHNPNRIGILGFSAGGHLSARASTQFEKRAYSAIDEIDKVSCRPDFTLLIYPAYLFDKNAEGINADIQVTEQTPPMFLTMAWDDPIDPENVLRMSTALKRAKVRNEVHLFPSGGHGYGLRPSKHQASGWPELATKWLESQGLLKTTP